VEIILLQNVPALGNRGDIVKVKAGYARNYLFPRRIALLATDSNMNVLKEEEKLLVYKDFQVQEAAREQASKMAETSCTIPVQVGEEDKLYGSVTANDIAGELNKQGYEIEKKQVLLEEPIKKLGVYKITLQLHKQVTVPIKVWVVKE